MQGPTQRWDQSPDPRESTVSMPRVDPSWLADQVSESATAAYDGGTGTELPGFGDPYALPARAAGPGPVAAAAPAPTTDPAVLPERAASPGPVAAAPPEAEAPEAAAPEPAAPELPAVPADQMAPDLHAVPDEQMAPADQTAPEMPGPPRAAGPSATAEPRRRAMRRAEPDSPDKPPAGSVAELRGRLERLPDGHPSSPYDDGGWLRPSPTRIRQLELGLPARSPGTPAGYAERFGVDPDDDATDGVPRAAPPGQPAPQPAAEGLVTPQPEVPSPPARPTAANGRHEPSDGYGRLRLQHPYGASAEHDHGGSGSPASDLPMTRWPAEGAAERESGPADGRNGHHPTANQPAASLAEPGGPARDRRGPDQGRSDLPRHENGAGAARPRLAPEHRDLVDRIVAACRAAEGQNARGGYGTSGLTPALRRVAAQLPAGGLASGSEADTLKPADRFATRLARLIERQPGRPPAELAATISDGIRYAFTFPAADYTEGTLLVHRKLKAQGFDLEARRNQWDSREYRGIFTRWRDPAHGLAFEVQFHTLESWAVVKQTHDAYLRITDPATPPAERARLRAHQAAAAATVSPPPGCLDIADFRAGSR